MILTWLVSSCFDDLIPLRFEEDYKYKIHNTWGKNCTNNFHFEAVFIPVYVFPSTALSLNVLNFSNSDTYIRKTQRWKWQPQGLLGDYLQNRCPTNLNCPTDNINQEGKCRVTVHDWCNIALCRCPHHQTLWSRFSCVLHL